MRTYRIIAIALLLLCLLAACGGPAGTPATTETTTDAAIVTTTEAATETEPETAQAAAEDLFNLALINRLFSMTLADFFQEEGEIVDPVDWFEAGPYYAFSKYDPESYFFFDGDEPDKDKLNAMAVETSDLLVNKYSLTLGELKQWLDEKNITLVIHEETEEDSLRCVFTMGRHTLTAYMDSENDEAIVRRVFVKPRG